MKTKKEQKMKAYECWDGYDQYAVIYAKTAGKARADSLFIIEDADFTDISVKRVPELDEFYNGDYEADWDDMRVRRVLVQRGWNCGELANLAMCEKCDVHEDCMIWEDVKHNFW